MLKQVPHRIVHMTSVHHLQDTRILTKECQTLARGGFKVSLIVPTSRTMQVEGVKVIPVKRYNNRVLRFIFTGFDVFKAAWAERASLHHIHDPELLPWAQILRRFGRRVIYDMHENVPAAIFTKAWIHPNLRMAIATLFKHLEHKFLKGLAIIFAENSYEAAYLDSNSPKVTILNLPIAEEILSIKSAKYEVYTVGYIGAISPLRGSVATAWALRILNQEMELNWECIGHLKGSHQKELVEIVGEAHSHRLNFRGRMELMDGLRLISKCQVGLALLGNTPNYRDSFPTKMFEYMALGVPVVASDFPLYRQVIEQARCGICVPPDDVQGIADAIRHLILNPREALEMGRRGRTAVSHMYNWTYQGEKLVSFYQELLGDGQQTSSSK